jgi:two-component system, OmpR family, response regulator MtrA
MSVTVLRTHTPRPYGHPRTRRDSTRPAELPVTVTLTIGVTLTGDRPHRDALDFIDGLNRLAEGVGARLSIASAPAPKPPVSLVRPAGPAEPGEPAEIEMHPGTRVVRRHGAPIALTRVEYDLLAFLVDHPQQVFTRRQLLSQIWGDDGNSRRTVDVHVSRLRSKLGADLVATTRGVGYRLAEHAPIRVIHHHQFGDGDRYEQ